MSKQYLDKDGLRAVADNVNKRLKTVTEMPPMGDSVLLYVGETTETYTRGHIYQFDAQYWFCYKTVPEIDPAGPHYIYLNTDKTKYGNDQLGTIVTSSDEFTSIEDIPPELIVRDDGIYVDIEGTETLSYVPDIEHDLDESKWVDITDTEAIEVASGAMALAQAAFDNSSIEPYIDVYGSTEFKINKTFNDKPIYRRYINDESKLGNLTYLDIHDVETPTYYYYHFIENNEIVKEVQGVTAKFGFNNNNITLTISNMVGKKPFAALVEYTKTTD